MSHASHQSSHGASGHEGGGASDGVNLKKVITVGVVSLALFAAGIAWAVYLLNAQRGAAAKRGLASEPSHLYQQEIGIVDNVLFSNDNRLKEFRTERTAWLNSYGWADRKAGLIHMPIERAMAEVVAEASRPEAAPQLPPPAPAPQPEPVKPTKAARAKAPAKATAAPAQGAAH